MILNPTNINGCFELLHSVHVDHRGGFMELRRDEELKKHFPEDWVQTNVSYSFEGTLRGLHVTPYSKIVTCVSGDIYDIVVDLRRESPTFREYFAVYMNKDGCKQVYVPAGCGHGFLAMNEASVIYQQSGYYQPEREQAFNIRDPELKIIIPKPKFCNVSQKDAEAENFPF
jgi:dTDP-4-dehydrorhamnose 3,5-epimerase